MFSWRLCQVQRSAVQTLTSADIDDVPVIVRFLLQTVTPADAHMVLIDCSVNGRVSHIHWFKIDGSCRINFECSINV